MPFAWRDLRTGRVRKLRQGGETFLPWPQQQQQEEEEEIPRGAIVINARSWIAAWGTLIIDSCASRQQDVEKNAEEQRNMGHHLSRKRKAGGQGMQKLNGHHEIASIKRKLIDDQEQGLQNLEEGHDVAAEQRLQNLILSLPRDVIVHKVLPCLPLPKIFELRCVSREWKSLLCSTRLMQQCIAAQQGHQAWLVMAGKAPGPDMYAKEFIAYVPHLGRWIPFPLPRNSSPISTLLGCHAELLQEGEKFHRQCNPATIHMTSAGGLVCCIVYNVRPLDMTPKEGPNYTVLVFNPLTGHMKTLPPILFSDLSFSHASLYMLYDQAHNTYKIIVSYGSYRLRIIHVYDSKSGSWKITRPHASSSMGILNADLYFYVEENDVYMLHGYHMESDTWSSLIVPAPPIFEVRNGSFFLKKLNGRVLLAYDFRPSVAPAELQGFTVWELNYSSSSLSAAAAWVQVARTPPKFWNQFHDLSILGNFANDTSFITNGRLLCMTVADFVDDAYGGYYSTPLVYDLAVNSWYRLPPYKGSKRFMGLFSFHPTLNVPDYVCYGA